MSGYYIIPSPKDFLNLSGGTVTGNTLFTENLSGSNIFITSGLTQNDLLNQVLVYNPVTFKLEFRDANSIGTVGNFVHITGDTMTGRLITPSFSGTSISGDTFYSGSTPLSSIFPYSGTNVGSGNAQVFAGKSNGLLEFKTLSANTRITLTGTNDTIVIQTSGINNYYIQTTAPVSTPSSTLYDGDRWFNTTDGIECVWMDDGNSSQWVEIITSFSGTNISSGTPGYIGVFDSSTTLTDTSTPMFETGGGIVVGATSIQSSAIFQIDSTAKGFLPPRMTQTQLNAIGSPAVGLMIYQTDGVEGLYIFKSDNHWHLLG